MKAHTLSYTHSKVGNDQMHIHGEMNSGKWTLSRFVRSCRSPSWRNELWKVNFKQVCKKPSGVLMVIWSGFAALTRAFLKGDPTIHKKHMPSGMGTESLGMIGCIFAENGPSEGGIESSLNGTVCGAKGDFIRFSYLLYPYISRTHTFFESTCPKHYAQQSWEWSDAYSWRNDL